MEDINKRIPNDRCLQLQVHGVARALKKSRVKSMKILDRQVAWALEDLKVARKLYDSMDTEGRGYIETTSLAPLFRTMGMKITEDDLKAIVEEIDVDKSGTIEWAEFLYLVDKYGGVRNWSIESQFTEEKLHQLRNVFDYFDADGSGDIDTAELREVMRKFGLNPTKKELYHMIEEVDADGSGTIDWYEFLFLLSKSTDQDQLSIAHKRAFQMFEDPNQPDSVNCENFKTRILTMAKGAVDANDISNMIKSVKTDNDDYSMLTYKEFVLIMSA